MVRRKLQAINSFESINYIDTGKPQYTDNSISVEVNGCHSTVKGNTGLGLGETIMNLNVKKLTCLIEDVKLEKKQKRKKFF